MHLNSAPVETHRCRIQTHAAGTPRFWWLHQDPGQMKIQTYEILRPQTPVWDIHGNWERWLEGIFSATRTAFPVTVCKGRVSVWHLQEVCINQSPGPVLEGTPHTTPFTSDWLQQQTEGNMQTDLNTHTHTTCPAMKSCSQGKISQKNFLWRH